MTARIVASSLVVAAVLGPCAAFAQETFQAEAGLSYLRFKASDVRNNTAGADATYYFDKLPSRPDYPLEQARFVERSGSLGLNYSRSRSDITGQERLSDGRSYGANLLLARPDLRLIAQLGYQSASSGKTKNSVSQDELEADAKVYQASIGAYVAKTTDLLLNWTRTETDLKSNTAPTSTITQTRVGLSGEHLMRLSWGDYLALVAAISQDTRERLGLSSQKNQEYAFQGTYYPTNMLGITAGVSFNRGDDTSAEGETYIAGVRMFFTLAFSVSLDYQRFLANAPDNNRELFAVRAALRF